MPIKEGELGMIEISTTAVSTIADQAINQCYGVVGMANKNLVNSITTMLSGDNRRGINVQRQRAKFFEPRTGIANTIGERLPQRRADLGKLTDLMGQLAVA